MVSIAALSQDLSSAASTPNYVFISLNQCNDMHSCSSAIGDTWLKKHVPAILQSPACTSNRCLVAITWVEDNGNHENRVLTIFAGLAAKTGGVKSFASDSHCWLLRTMEYLFGLPTQSAHDAIAGPMTDMLR